MQSTLPKPTTSRPRRSLLASTLVVLALGTGSVACDAQGEATPADTTQAASEEGSGHGGGHGHGAGHEHGHGAGHGAGHGSGHGSGALETSLLSVDALPEGYRRGAGHHTSDSDTPPPAVRPECAPIAELIGTHPSVHQDEHPQATHTFSRGHFGPTVTETVIDYGGEQAARQAQARLERSATECGRYVQSASSIGANEYGVEAEVPDWRGPQGTTIRLEALGSDFDDGLYWDMWVTRADARLVAVTFRSALGGDNAELAPAVDAARDTLAES